MEQNKCECVQSCFLYKTCGHIITGDLAIVNNKKLRNLFEKGAKYREPKTFDWKKVREEATRVANEYINKINTLNTGMRGLDLTIRKTNIEGCL